MVGQQISSFGSWTSPITAGVAVAETGSLSEPRIDGDNIYWIEGRPLEKGRNSVRYRIVKWPASVNRRVLAIRY